MKKRLIGVFLIISILLSLVPFNAFADGTVLTHCNCSFESGYRHFSRPGHLNNNTVTYPGNHYVTSLQEINEICEKEGTTSGLFHLANDVYVTEAWSCPNGNITICTLGYDIIINAPYGPGYDAAIYVGTEDTLTITNVCGSYYNNYNGPSKITGNSDIGSAFYCKGVLSLFGVDICMSGPKAKAVKIFGGTLNLFEGNNLEYKTDMPNRVAYTKIHGNPGGGIHVDNHGTLNMYGGEIYENGSSGIIDGTSLNTINIFGGTIKDNNGYGLELDSGFHTIANLYGGTITGNKAGGIFLYGSELNLHGDYPESVMTEDMTLDPIKVTGNLNYNILANFEYTDYRTNTITVIPGKNKVLTKDSVIGICSENTRDKKTTSTIIKSTTASSDFFTSDIDGCYVDNENGAMVQGTITPAPVKTKNITAEYTAKGVSASLADDNSGIAGVWSWKNTAPTTVSDTGTHTVVFTPTQKKYSKVETDVQVTITPKNLTVSGAKGVDRQYSAGNKTVDLANGTLVGVCSGDENKVELRNEHGTIPSDAVGTKEVTAQYTLTGNKASNYTLIQPTGLTATISMGENTWVISPFIPNTEWFYGTEAKPPIAAAKYGNCVIEYKLSSAPDSSYHTEFPTQAGDYIARFTVDATDNYTGLSETRTFKILPISITVKADNISKTYNDTDPQLTYTVSNEVLEGDTITGISISRQKGESVGEYDINVTVDESANPNYRITCFDGTFTINKKQLGVIWGDLTFAYDGNSHIPTAMPTGVVNNEEVFFKLSGAQTEIGKDYVVTITGLSGKNANNYLIPTNNTAKFSIKGNVSAPEIVFYTAETIDEKCDGIIYGVNNTMEYRLSTNTAYTTVTGNTIENLADGTYCIRYKETDLTLPSPDTEVTLFGDKKLKIELPTEQYGYVITCDKTELKWHESAVITYSVKDGFTSTNPATPLIVNCTRVPLTNGKYTITNAEQDYIIESEVVEDITPPTATINIGTNSWSQFFNDITFGLFFKDTQTVTITAQDVNTGSGVVCIDYYLSKEQLTLTEVKNIPDYQWHTYSNGITLNPQDEYIIYAFSVDNAGNRTYVSTAKGIVIDTVAPIVNGISDGYTYYGDTSFTVEETHLNTVTIDGNVLTATDGKYTIIADSLPHTIVATDKAGNTSTTLTVTVIKFADIDSEIKNITLNTVTSSNTTAVNNVIRLANSLLESDRVLTADEIALLQAKKANSESLLAKIAEISAKINDLKTSVNTYNICKVSSADRNTLIDNISQLDTLISSTNITDTERASLKNLKATAQNLVSYIDANKGVATHAGGTTLVNAKKATATANGKLADTKCEKCGEIIKKGATVYKASNITLSTSSCTYDGKAKTPSVTVKNSKGSKLTLNKDYTVAYASGRTNVGTYKVTITLKGNYSGTVVKTFKINAKKVTPTVSNYPSKTYNGKAQTQKLTVKVGKTTLKSSQYTVKYSSNTWVGKATIKVTLKGNYSGTKTVTFKINPKGTSLKSVAGGKKQVTVKWNKQGTQTSGYQVQYSTSKSFKGAKTVTVSSNKTTSKTIKNLTGGKKYYVRVRTYKTVGKTKYYSAWSSSKYATAKKK